VFDAVLEKALGLCGAEFGVLTTFDGRQIHPVAHRGVSPEHAEFLASGPQDPGPRGSISRFLNGEHFIHEDLANSEDYRAGDRMARALVEIERGRSLAAVPLRSHGGLLGHLVIYRREVRPFTEKQIALLQSFAVQAVIAIENARLHGELQARTRDLEESLEYQTATSDVPKVISGSTFEIQPVFQTIVETAARLCDADQAAIYRRDGEAALLALNFGFPAEYEAAVAAVGTFPLDPTRPETPLRAMREGRPVHVHDVAAVLSTPERNCFGGPE